MTEPHAPKRPSGRLKAWGGFFLCVFLLWAFTFHGAPWLQKHVPGMPRLTKRVMERDIDTTAFFYSENKESYEAERYLNDTLGLAKPRGYDGFDRYFILGIALCLVILAIGFRLMSFGIGNKADDRTDQSC